MVEGFPIGVKKHFIISKASIIIKAGVKNLPTLSTTLLGVKTKNNVMAKKTNELVTELMPNPRGFIAIS